MSDERPGERSAPARRPGDPPDDASPLLYAQTLASFEGPLPPPNVLAAYDEVVPGAAERLLDMAEKQARHRQHLERLVVEGAHRRANQGLWVGFAVAVLFLAASVWLILTDHGVYGAVLGTVDLVALVTVFVVGRSEQRREREAKRPG